MCCVPRWLVVCICLLAGAAGRGHAQSAQVDAYVEADSLRIGAQTTLWLVATHSFQSQVLFPDADTGPTLFGDLEVLARGTPRYRYGGTGQPGGRVDSVGYTVTTFALDEAQVPALPVWIVRGRDTTTVGAAAFAVPVPSVLPSDTTTAMQPLAPVFAFPYSRWQWAGWAALAAALLALGVWGYRRYRSREPAAGAAGPPASPYEAATRTLHALNPDEAAEAPKAFYTALTQAVRAYAADRLQLKARERTTAELVAALDGHRCVPESAARRLQAVLELADLAKFADARPAADANARALRETKQALDRIEQTCAPEDEATGNDAPSGAATA